MWYSSTDCHILIYPCGETQIGAILKNDVGEYLCLGKEECQREGEGERRGGEERERG